MLDARPLPIEKKAPYCMYSRFLHRRLGLHVWHLDWTMGVFVSDVLRREISFSWRHTEGNSPVAGLRATQSDNRNECRGWGPGSYPWSWQVKDRCRSGARVNDDHVEVHL